MRYIEQNSALHQKLQQLRQTLHAQPETAFEEFQTATLIADYLKSLGNIEVHEGIAVTGVVGVLTGALGDNGKMIGLRADIDALDITEQNDFDYQSKVMGKMHACGHDGHTAMLLLAASYLSQHNDFAGKIAFIFQPAEENRGGGDEMVKAGLFEKFPCQSVYGMHNWPGLAVGEFAVHHGAVMASTDSFDIEIFGKGTHAAMPNLGIDPIAAGAAIIQSLQTIVARNVAPTDTAVVSVTQMNAGSAYNIVPDHITLSGTIRSFENSVRELLKARVTALAENIAIAYGASAQVHFHDAYPATINHAEHADIAIAALEKIVGRDKTHIDLPPSMGAEDFSYLLAVKPGAYIWIGNGEQSAPLHHPEYDFNDEILPLGANYWIELSYQCLK